MIVMMLPIMIILFRAIIVLQFNAILDFADNNYYNNSVVTLASSTGLI